MCATKRYTSRLTDKVVLLTFSPSGDAGRKERLFFSAASRSIDFDAYVFMDAWMYCSSDVGSEGTCGSEVSYTGTIRRRTEENKFRQQAKWGNVILMSLFHEAERPKA
jgi:hypothetical protein